MSGTDSQERAADAEDGSVGRAAGPDTYAELRAVYGGRVSFIGAGPGAADLITVRGARRITEADVVVWAASLVAPECVHEHARADAELIDSSKITLEEVLAIYRRAAREKLRVARVHSGDPALWGAVQEQYDACVRLGLEVEIVPGVSAFSAAAAAIGRELTVPEVAQSIVLTRLEGGKTPMPPGERIRDFARHGTTMAVFLSAARTGQLAEELRAGGYAEDTPVVVAYKASWPDELLLYTTLGELELTVKQNKLWRHTLFLVGRALDAAGTRSRLYHAGHFHTYRKADPAARQALRAESAAGSSGSANGAASDALTEPARGRRSKRWSAAARRAGQVATRLPAAPETDAAPADRISQYDLGRAEDSGPIASSASTSDTTAADHAEPLAPPAAAPPAAPSDEAEKPAKTASSNGTTASGKSTTASSKSRAASGKSRAASTSSNGPSESTGSRTGRARRSD